MREVGHAGGPVTFMNRTYDEAIGLLVEARDWLIRSEPGERDRLASADRLTMTLEATRMTTQITQVIAWLMVQKAIAEGELAWSEATRPEHRLGGRSVCLDATGAANERLPESLRDLLDRSRRLYVRVSRLDELVAAQAVGHA
ncbi:MAG: DUF1465 family protein [Alphaproteobacteria bacterium]